MYSVTVPTNGIIISGRTFKPSLVSSAAASNIALACISVITGYAIPSLHPRCPSIGLSSWRLEMR